MSYTREIPRDLFNEASLLKCFGRLYICLESRLGRNITLKHGGEAFDVRQDKSDGSIYLANVTLHIGGQKCELRRPLNSREPWPLWVETIGGDYDFDAIKVFTECGELSPEFLALLD